jgi:hypothetical protein
MQTRNLFALDGLTDIAAHGIDMRPTLLRVLTDLYVHRFGHTAAEQRHYTELALRLLEAVDVRTRAGVARRLARHPSPPAQVMEWLARDVPEVANELLAAESPPPQTPAFYRDRPAATLNEHETVSARAIDVATAAEANELFLAADAIERRLILRNLHLVAPVAPHQIRVARDAPVLQNLETAALSRNRAAFTQHLAAALKIGYEQAERIATDRLGEGLVVAAKALGMPRGMFYRILLFANPAIGHSVQRVHSLAALFEEVELRAATSMVATWQALLQDRSSRARHRPLAWDDEKRRRAAPPGRLQRNPFRPAAQRRDAS